MDVLQYVPQTEIHQNIHIHVCIYVRISAIFQNAELVASLQVTLPS